MNIPKQLLNLLGAVLVLAVLAGGALLVALPVYAQSRTTTADAATVAQTNSGFEAQVASLRESEADLDDIQASVSALHRQIPAEPLMDEVFEVAAAAATEAGVTVVTAIVGDIVAWTPRAELTPDFGVAEADASTPPTEESVAPIEEADPATPDEGLTDVSTGETRGEGTGSAPAADVRTQVDVTLTLTAPNAEAAERFIDELGEGERLISIVHASLTPATAGYNLTVNALAFIRAEN